jgi:transcriptional regulator with XRE-family HTH domain
MNTSQTLRTNIIKCLSDRKMSQIQLAVATQLHESVISRILAGKREINVYHLDKILMALQLDILTLLHYPEKVYLAHASNEKITITLTPNPTTL